MIDVMLLHGGSHTLYFLAQLVGKDDVMFGLIRQVATPVGSRAGRIGEEVSCA